MFKEAKAYQDSSSHGSKASNHDGRPKRLGSEPGARPNYSIRLAWKPYSPYS